MERKYLALNPGSYYYNDNAECALNFMTKKYCPIIMIYSPYIDYKWTRLLDIQFNWENLVVTGAYTRDISG